MNKTLKAWLYGYVLFRVNDRKFLTYNGAHAACATILRDQDASVAFEGLHITGRWLGFIVRYV